MSDFSFYVGAKLKDKRVSKYVDAAEEWMFPGEHLVAVFRTNSLKPLIDALLVTNARFAGISGAELRNPEKAFRNVIALAEISQVQIEKGRLGAYKLRITTRDQATLSYGDLNDDDVAAVRGHLEAEHETTSEAALAASAAAEAAKVAAAGARERTEQLEAVYKHLLRGDQRLLAVLELRKLEDEIRAEERLINLATGTLALDNDRGSRNVSLVTGNPGLLVLTDRRVVFFDRAVMKTRVHDFPLDRIASVQTEIGVMLGRIRINAMGSTAEIRQVDPKERAAEIGGYVRDAMSASGKAASSPSPPPPEPDILDQIEKLAGLRNAGILTTEEFASKKAELLKRL